MFRVLWLPGPRNDLTRIWLAADPVLRAAITAASNAIDQELAEDPFRDTESRDGERRILLRWPLGVIVEVDQDEALVFVVEAWRIPRPGQA